LIEEENSAGQILKASAIMGSSSVIIIGAGIINAKIMAVLLGPQGIGLLSILSAIFNMIGALFGMGIASSGVRQIAEAHYSGDQANVTLVRRSILLAANVLGLLGALTIIIFRVPIVMVSFSSTQYLGLIPWLGLGVWASIVAGALTAFLNGLRRIGDLAKINVIGSLGGMLIGVVAVLRLGTSGVPMIVIGSPIVTLLACFLYARKVNVSKIKSSLSDIIRPMKYLFRLGLVFMLTGFMQVGTQYVVRVIITRTLGLAATGQFQATWNISMMYLGFVLTAMAVDYYPRLTAVAKDNKVVNYTVNEQARIAMLLAGPVILGMLTFSFLVIRILYTNAFGPAVGILHWQLMGDIFKVAGWAMGYILLAQAHGRIYFITELFWNSCYIFLLFGGIRFWGLEATGTAFLLSYILYFFFMWFLTFKITGFTWSRENQRLLLLMTGCLFVFIYIRYLPGIFPLLIGCILTAGMGTYSLARLFVLLGKPNLRYIFGHH
jgi:PST family polysaccharide transporter